MRILALVTDAFGGRGGIALCNRNLLTALCEYPDCKEIIAIPRLISDQLEPMPANLKYVQEGLSNKIKYVETVLKNVKNASKINLILCGHINLIPLAYIVSLWLKIPILLIIHGIEAWQPTRSYLINYLAKKIQTFVAVSKVTKKRFLSWSNVSENKGYVLPNAIHPEIYGAGPKNQALLDRYGLNGKKILMTMGRMSKDERYKGFDEVIELLPRLSKKNADITYLIVGDGSDRRRLEEKVVSLGLSEKVIFVGFIPANEKADYFRLADVYVMPGRGEGFGFVFLEAMACGVPVIASKVDGSREAVLNGKLGMVVDPENSDEIEGAILKALDYPKGKIPDGLEHFYFNNYKTKLHGIVDVVMSGGQH